MPLTTSAGFTAIGPKVAAAVYAALNVPAFTALSTIGEDEPQAAALPYTRLDDFVETKNDTAGKHGRDVVFALHVWAIDTPTAGRKKAAAAILNQAIALLEYQPLAVAGLTLKACQYDGATQNDEIEGVPAAHLIATFRVGVSES
jgi:hypothetical protein